MKHTLSRLWNRFRQQPEKLQSAGHRPHSTARPLSAASRCVWQLDSEA